MEPSASVADVDEPPRTAKFLCSFGGAVLPRPLDGRLRYVGGETRIVTVARDISYADLLIRMRELFEGVDIIKYQQPEEDLDALVSVVNDEDVMNMMEEYDKLIAAGEGFTRLRIFLFSQNLDGDSALVAAHFDADERENERRYVDALNSLNDAKSLSPPDISDHLYENLSMEGGFPNPMNLRRLNIPHSPHGQRYGELDSPWSPAYFSPGQYGARDPRDQPLSPPSVRFHVGAEEFGERISEELAGQSPVLRHFDHQSPQVENVIWLPPGTIVREKAGFPDNLGRYDNFSDGRNICENCRVAFQRNQGSALDCWHLDPRWRHPQTHFEQSNMMNDYAASCVECCHNREAYMVNRDLRLDNGIHAQEHRDHHHPFYNDSVNHDRNWYMQNNQGNHQFEDPRLHPSATGRMTEPYAVAQGNFYEFNSAASNLINHDTAHSFHPSTGRGKDIFQTEQMAIGGSPVQAPGFVGVAQNSNNPSAFGADSFYQVQHNLTPIQSVRRKAQVPVLPGESFDLPGLAMPNGGSSSSFLRNTPDGSPTLLGISGYDQSLNSSSAYSGSILQKIPASDASSAMEYSYHQGSRLKPNIAGLDTRFCLGPDSAQCIPGTQIFTGAVTDADSRIQISDKAHQVAQMHEATHAETSNEGTPFFSLSAEVEPPTGSGFCGEKSAEKEANSSKLSESCVSSVPPESRNISVGRLNLLPELIASVKRAALEDIEGVEAKPQANADSSDVAVCDNDESVPAEVPPKNVDAELEADSEDGGDQMKIPAIEPTTAEAEALSKGLQTIKNDDLEEIKELGSGTYGAVYHGKWRGSDVAIKRIKASCFAGRPSERERLIADFWKEALILSSQHHPNVVSFYGVVRDGPDGSLATVTEFMVNGSLKQFLQKKDRTIDRRKRLIIAMDVAFGMEYLHGKNIVHFDLKCENLLVNMRDPHRPICKIGDLGLSKVKQHTLVSGGVRGTLPWMAPELLSGKSHMVSEKIDVYSFGIVMWELLTGEEPYADMRCASIIGGIVNNTLRPQIPTWCDPEWKSLMESCWSSEPAERPSFSEISERSRKMAAAINVK